MILSPLFFVYGLNELKRGWKILVEGEKSLNIAVQTRIWLWRLIYGDREAEKYEKRFKANNDLMKREGIYSLVGGGVSLLVSVFWIWMLYKSLL